MEERFELGPSMLKCENSANRVTERLVLLPHILRMVIERHPDIQEPNVNVAALEKRSMETLSSWFADRTHPNNAKKENMLKELFSVAKMEERYRRNEIGTLLLIL